MRESDMRSLRVQMDMRMENINLRIYRYLHHVIDWSDRLICVKGARGVGKTTLLLQRLKEYQRNKQEALYVSLDNMWFQTHELMELVDYFYAHGGLYLFLDEIHYLPHWQTILKNIYDTYTNLHVVYTGSSMLELVAHEGDLSRRQITYSLAGLSFREFLIFEGLSVGEPIPLEEIISRHEEIVEDYLLNHKVLSYFEQYLQYGYYPFYKEVGKKGFYWRLQTVIRQILENELPAVDNVSYATIQKIQKMFVVLAQNVPQTPNLVELYRQLETNRENGLRMLYLLQRAELISLFSSEEKRLKNLGKPDKIYLENPNLMYTISPNDVDTGTLRETFFYNQIRAVGRDVFLPKQGDFEVDGKYLFEVGGPNKSFDQIADIPNSYLAIDDIERGYGSRIPLWVFGLMY